MAPQDEQVHRARSGLVVTLVTSATPVLLVGSALKVQAVLEAIPAKLVQLVSPVNLVASANKAPPASTATQATLVPLVPLASVVKSAIEEILAIEAPWVPAVCSE
jgi:hypothetical protein